MSEISGVGSWLHICRYAKSSSSIVDPGKFPNNLSWSSQTAQSCPPGIQIWISYWILSHTSYNDIVGEIILTVISWARLIANIETYEFRNAYPENTSLSPPRLTLSCVTWTTKPASFASCGGADTCFRSFIAKLERATKSPRRSLPFFQ